MKLFNKSRIVNEIDEVKNDWINILQVDLNSMLSNNIQLTLQKYIMNQNFSEIGEKKCITNEQTNQNANEKYNSSIDSQSSCQNHQTNQNQFFEIRTLILNQSSQYQQKCNVKDRQTLQIAQEKKKDDIKSPVTPKLLKKLKTISMQSIFAQYQYYQSKINQPVRTDRLFEYTRRRNSAFGEEIQNKIDLGVYNLLEVVQFCVNKKIISNEAFINFTFQSTSNIEQSFVDKLNKKQYELIQYEKMYFTPVDHRLLAKILSTQFPNQFEYPKKLLMQNSRLTAFYNFLYWLSENEYQQICSTLNLKFSRIWMPKDIPAFIDTVGLLFNNNKLFLSTYPQENQEKSTESIFSCN